MGVEEKEGKDNNSDGKDGEKCRYPSIEGFFSTGTIHHTVHHPNVMHESKRGASAATGMVYLLFTSNFIFLLKRTRE